VLPFGLSVAPLIFTKCMRELVGFWRSGGLRLLVYLDDFLFLFLKGKGGPVVKRVLQIFAEQDCR
jgi:hypothetical protein